MSAAAILRWKNKCQSFPNEVVNHSLLYQQRTSSKTPQNEGALWNAMLSQMPHIEWSERMIYGVIIGLYDMKTTELSQKLSTITDKKDKKDAMKTINNLKLQHLKLMIKINEDLLVVSPKAIGIFVCQYVDRLDNALCGLYEYYIKNRDQLLARVYSRAESQIDPLAKLPLYQLIKIKAFCPWEIYGNCQNNTCLQAIRIIHQLCLFCGQRHSPSECHFNKAMKSRRPRNRGRGRGRYFASRRNNNNQFNNNNNSNSNNTF